SVSFSIPAFVSRAPACRARRWGEAVVSAPCPRPRFLRVLRAKTPPLPLISSDFRSEALRSRACGVRPGRDPLVRLSPDRGSGTGVNGPDKGAQVRVLVCLLTLAAVAAFAAAASNQAVGAPNDGPPPTDGYFTLQPAGSWSTLPSDASCA